MQRVVRLVLLGFFSLLHTLTLPGLLPLHGSTCFLINYFKDILYQNYKTKLPIPSLPLMAIYRQVSGKKKCSILSKLKERNEWRAALASNIRLTPRTSEDAIHRAMHISRIIPVSYLTSPSCPLSAKSISLPWSKLSFLKKAEGETEIIKIELRAWKQNWKVPKIQDIEFSIIQGWGISDPLARDSLLHRYRLQHCFPTAFDLIIFCLIKMYVNAGSTKVILRFNRTSAKKGSPFLQ